MSSIRQVTRWSLVVVLVMGLSGFSWARKTTVLRVAPRSAAPSAAEVVNEAAEKAQSTGSPASSESSTVVETAKPAESTDATEPTEPTEATESAESGDTPVSVTDSAQALGWGEDASAQEDVPFDVLAKSGPATVVWTNKDLKLYQHAESGKDKLMYSWLEDTKTMTRDWRDTEAQLAVRLLSVVGPLVSYEQSSEFYSKGAAHPASYSDIVAWDIKAPKTDMLLTDWFEDHDVLRALYSHPALLPYLKASSQPPLSEFRSAQAYVNYLHDAVQDCKLSVPENMLASFAFVALDNDSATVELGAPHGCEVERGRLTRLQLTLPMTTKLRRLVSSADTVWFLPRRTKPDEAMVTLTERWSSYGFDRLQKGR
ncbi:MAG: hypothetical protein KC476_10005 [Cyanobacteria bacterium HKST-UBA06]|nr:hypothetical protein [Cyanobacteria bacterium HKST-UBA06]